MDWKLLSIVPGIFLVVVFMLSVWFGGKLWQKSKFLSLICFILAGALAIGFYAIYGKQIFG